MSALTEYDYEYDTEQGVYPLIKSIDKSVRKVNNDLYDFRRETNYRLSAVEGTVSKLVEDVTDLKTRTAIIEEGISDLKDGLKELNSNVSDLKGDMRELLGNFTAVQSRFNWILIIIGIVIALIQMLK